MASATTIRKRVFNDHYEETTKKLKEIKPQVWQFLNRDNETVHYLEEFDRVLHGCSIEFVDHKLETLKKEQQEQNNKDKEYQNRQLEVAINALVNIACYTYAPNEEHPAIYALNDLLRHKDDGKTVTFFNIRDAMHGIWMKD